MADSPIDKKVLSLVREAEKGMRGLQAELSKTLKKLKTGDIDQAKTLNASKKLMAFMKKFIPVTKLQNSSVYDNLSAEAKAKVDWMDSLMGQMLGTLNKLNKAKNDAKKDPAKNYDYLVKASKKALSEGSKAPPGVGTLLKQIKKANDPNFDGASGLAILPMAILLWMILDMLVRGLKKKP